MTDFVTVVGNAIVRARDGSSIEDWDEDSGLPPDDHLADPDRIHAAIEAIEEAGLTVEAVGDFDIAFSGTADAASALFGTTVDTTDPDAPVWASTGGPTSRLQLPSGHPLSQQIDSVTCDARPEPYARTLDANTVPPETVLDRDLLLGELGPALGSGWPARFQSVAPAFPVATIDAETRASIGRWRNQLLTTSAGRPLAANKRQTRVTIIEPYGGLGAPELLRDYQLIPVQSRFQSQHAARNLQGVYDAPAMWPTYRSAKAELVLQRLTPAEARLHVERRRLEVMWDLYTKPGNQTDYRAGVFRQRITDTADALEETLTHLDKLLTAPTSLRKDNARPAADDLSSVKRPDLRKAVADLRAAAGGPVAQLDQAHRHIGVLQRADAELRPFRTKLSALNTAMLADRALAMLQMEYHSQMVATAVHAVTLGTVPATLRCDLATADILWTAPGLVPGPRVTNEVFSASFGSPMEASPWSAKIASRRRTASLRLRDRRTLHVIAVGNKGLDGGRPSRNLVWSGCDNVVLVGGCEPIVQPGSTNLMWAATDATHGYRFRAGQKRYSIPDICAPTKGVVGGGSLIVPTRTAVAGQLIGMGGLQPGPWVAAAGSSLACPIVAGAAALVWSYFPALSAPRIKEVLMDTAAPLGAAWFHRPPSVVPADQVTIVDDSEHVARGVPATDNPAGRVVLTAALAEAGRRAKEQHKLLPRFLQEFKAERRRTAVRR